MKDIQWIFFDVGSTLIDESNAYGQRFREIAGMADRSYESIIQEALMLYQHNKKGDLENCKEIWSYNARMARGEREII